MQQLLYCQQFQPLYHGLHEHLCHVTTAVEQLKLVGSYVEMYYACGN